MDVFLGTLTAPNLDDIYVFSRILIDVVLRNLTAARFKLDLRLEWQVLEI